MDSFPPAQPEPSASPPPRPVPRARLVPAARPASRSLAQIALWLARLDPAALAGPGAPSPDPADTDLVRRRLGAVADDLSRGEARVVFGGHFSSGKSTLLNALIGRDLLPTSDYPETGVACWIRAGRQDQAAVVTAAGTALLPFATAAIAEEVSLIDDSGDYRRRVEKIERIEVILADGGPPPGVVWVDSPGINDTEAMTERAAETAAAGDLLVWVINSRQAMSETEQEFLRTRLAGRGLAGLLVVVNAFLPADTAERWDWFLTHRASYYRARVVSAALVSTDETGPAEEASDVPASPTGPAADAVGFGLPVLPLSARAAAATHAGFGLEAVRAALTEATRPEGPRLRAARLERAVTSLRAVLAELELLAADERTALDRAQRHAGEHSRELADRDRRFDEAVTSVVGAVYDWLRESAHQAIADVAATVDIGPLRRDNTYGLALTGQLCQIADRLGYELVMAANRAAFAHGHGPVPATVLSEIQQMLRPPCPITVPVAASAAAGVTSGLGGALGGMTDKLISPAAGASMRTWIASLSIGPDRSAAADARDRADTRARVLELGGQALAALKSQQGDTVRVLREASPALPVAPPPPPDPSRLAGLRHLRWNVETAVLAAIVKEAAETRCLLTEAPE